MDEPGDVRCPVLPPVHRHRAWFDFFFWLPLPLLGVAPWAIYFAYGINLVYQFFVHTETIGKLPRPVEFVFNTPSHHRVHHGCDAIYLDRNSGAEWSPRLHSRFVLRCQLG